MVVNAPPTSMIQNKAKNPAVAAFNSLVADMLRNMSNIILIDSLAVVLSRTEETFDGKHYIYFPPDIPVKTILRCNDSSTRLRIIGDVGIAVAKLVIEAMCL